MKLYFKTKININGNNNIFIVDLDNKTYSTQYKSGDYVILTRKELDMLKMQFKNNGYKEEN